MDILKMGQIKSIRSGNAPMSEALQVSEACALDLRGGDARKEGKLATETGSCVDKNMAVEISDRKCF